MMMLLQFVKGTRSRYETIERGAGFVPVDGGKELISPLPVAALYSVGDRAVTIRARPLVTDDWQAIERISFLSDKKLIIVRAEELCYLLHLLVSF